MPQGPQLQRFSLMTSSPVGTPHKQLQRDTRTQTKLKDSDQIEHSVAERKPHHMTKRWHVTHGSQKRAVLHSSISALNWFLVKCQIFCSPKTPQCPEHSPSEPGPSVVPPTGSVRVLLCQYAENCYRRQQRLSCLLSVRQ